jgi:hypothetical protein
MSIRRTTTPPFNPNVFTVMRPLRPSFKVPAFLRVAFWLGVALLPIAMLADPPAPTYPQWWLDYGLAGAQPPAPGNTTTYSSWVQQNYAPANLGQLKNFATQANNYLQTWLGSDSNSTVQSDLSAINTTVSGFSTNATINYAPANLGQVKNLAKPIYDLLNAIGYDTQAQLNYLMYGNVSLTTWWYSYPWNPGDDNSVNYAPINLGQLKLVFSFDLSSTLFSSGSSADYITEFDESMLGGNPNSLTSGVPDTDGAATGNDSTHAFPLDPAFSTIPSLGGNDTTVPVITITTPTNVVQVE